MSDDIELTDMQKMIAEKLRAYAKQERVELITRTVSFDNEDVS